MAFYIGGGIGHTLIGQRPIGGGRYTGAVLAAIDQNAPSFTTDAVGTVGQKTVLATAILNAPPFTQSIDAQWYEYHEVTGNQTAPSFSQSITGSLAEVGVIATIDQSAPVFTQDIAGTAGQVVDNITATVVQTAPSFTTKATEAEAPPKYADLDLNAPAFSQSAAATTPNGSITATLVQNSPSFSTLALVDVQNDRPLTGNQTAPGFTQNISVNITFKYIPGTINQDSTVFTSDSAGTVGQKTANAIVNQGIIRPPVIDMSGNVTLDAITADISGNFPGFTQNSAGTIENKAISVNITSNAPAFTQNINAQYDISAKNAVINQQISGFSTFGRLSIGDVITQEAPKFIQRVTVNRTPNYLEVVQPEVMVSIGRRLDDDPIPDYWDTSTALYLDKKTAIQMNRPTKPITMNINVVTYIDFKQATTINTTQKKVMNYVGN